MRLSRLFRLTFLLCLFSVFSPLALAQSSGPPPATSGGAAAPYQGQTLTLSEALKLAVQSDAGVAMAQANLSAAQKSLTRTQADPLALKPALLQAKQQVGAAQDALAVAQLAAQVSAASAYFAALEADDALHIAKLQAQLDDTKLQAAQIRMKVGAATQLDVQQAQGTLASAQRGVQSAQQSRDLAYTRLVSLLGKDADTLTLKEPDEAPSVPPLADVLKQLDGNVRLHSAQRAVAQAQLQYDIVNNPYSARADIEAAHNALNDAQASLREIQRSLSLSVRQAYNAVLAAQGQLKSAQAALSTAQANLKAQQVRFQAGSISSLDLSQAKLQEVQAETGLHQAQHGLYKATLSLQQAALGSLTGQTLP